MLPSSEMAAIDMVFQKVMKDKNLTIQSLRVPSNLTENLD